MHRNKRVRRSHLSRGRRGTLCAEADMGRTAARSLYRNREPGEIPACTLVEASLWLDVPIGTVRDWTLGRGRDANSGCRSSQPLIEIADQQLDMLSFTNLAELFVLKGIREMGVSLPRVRRAVAFIQDRLRVEHALVGKEMLTDGTDLLVQHVIEQREELVNASRGGQLEMKAIVMNFLQRIDRDPRTGTPLRIFPFTSAKRDDAPRTVMIDPRCQFCQPCISGTRVPTSSIGDRYKAGESIAELAADFGLDSRDVEEAIRFELQTRHAA